eukprot:2205239-Rhodomonas_salina.1
MALRRRYARRAVLSERMPGQAKVRDAVERRFGSHPIEGLGFGLRRNAGQTYSEIAYDGSMPRTKVLASRVVR